MKIWYQSSTDFKTHPNYAAALKRHAAKVASPGTTVEFHGRETGHGDGLSMTEIISSPSVYHEVVHPEYFEALMRAEAAGFDAFVIGTYGEPLLAELRSLARIPIVSITEATFLASMTIAPRIGVITLSRLVVPYLEKSFEAHKIKDRIVAIDLVDEKMAEEDLDEQFLSPSEYLERLKLAIRRSIAAGAQVVVPAEGVMSMMAVSHGVALVDDVPVMDSAGAAILFAELQVALARRSGVSQSRVAYPPPSDEARKMLFGKDAFRR